MGKTGGVADGVACYRFWETFEHKNKDSDVWI